MYSVPMGGASPPTITLSLTRYSLHYYHTSISFSLIQFLKEVAIKIQDADYSIERWVTER